MTADPPSNSNPTDKRSFRLPKFNLNQVGLAIVAVNVVVGAMLLSKLQSIQHVAEKTANLEQKINELPTILNKSLADAVIDADMRRQGTGTDDQLALQFRSAADVEAHFASLGDSPEPADLANALTETEDWVIKEDDAETANGMREKQLERLRQLVAQKVTELQQQALQQPAARDGYPLHSQAQALLAYFPADASNAVTSQLRGLLNQQALVAAKLDALQRMRYNNWAASEISKALTEMDKIKPLNPFKRNNAGLVDIVAKYLGPIDPLLLEPATRQAYAFVVQTTQDYVGEKWKTVLPQRLTKLGTQRVVLSQF